MNLHVQPGGGVIVTAKLHDGRTVRVCGEGSHLGSKIFAELRKWLRWEGQNLYWKHVNTYYRSTNRLSLATRQNAAGESWVCPRLPTPGSAPTTGSAPRRENTSPPGGRQRSR